MRDFRCGRRVFTPSISALLAVVVCLPAACADPTGLTILHTSDLHGQVLPFDDARDTGHPGSLAQVATLVRRIRDEVSHPVLVLDSGDTIQGTPLELFTHVRWSRPSPTIKAMNLIRYDAMAVGNHEFNFGLEVLRRAERQAVFPFLSANTVAASTGKPAFEPYRVLDRGGLRVGVLGLTTTGIPRWEQPENYRGLRFEALQDTARPLIRHLRDRERCDLVVVLAHTGYDRESSGGSGSRSDGTLTRVKGIDVLLTGHTHRDIDPHLANGVVVSQPSSHARVLTRIDLDLERRDGRWAVAGWRGENIKTGSLPPDPSFVAAFDETHADVVAALSEPIGTVTAPVTVEGCRIRDCAAVDLIHSVQLEASRADLSIASLLTDRTPDLPKGTVNRRWVHALYVYPNTPVAVRLTGAQVKDVLEHAARYYDGIECGRDGGCTVLGDPDIPPYNVDSMAGVEYRIDPRRPEGDRVRDLKYRGSPIDPRRTFTLVCNNYRVAGGGGFPHIADAEMVWTSSSEMTDLIADHIAREDPWRPTADGNWSIVRRVTGERRGF